MPALNSYQPPTGRRATSPEAGDPMESLVWALWLAGYVLAITLLGMLVDQGMNHQGAAHGPDPARSAPDVGEA
ncbi:hypothetical protein ACFVVU_31590 [Kitasatospora sp. NPDC057965]|uniref:hypothetical protein n=1 Tax=Kitasatospora sp. NPDC057965 TaxID=3346291 RepID=UPI0036DB17A4